jgi:glycosyltransferase involved in cell wall biosynthesis
VKIVFVVRALGYGGAERQLVTVAEGLHRQGMEAVIVTFYCGGALESELQRSNIKTLTLGKKGRWDVFPALWRLVRVVRSETPSRIHTYLDVPNVLITLLKPFLGEARIVWGVRASDMELGRYDWLHRVAGWLAARASRFADLIIINSEAGRRHHIAHGYPDRKLVVIPNGIDVERFAPDAVARTQVRRELGIRDEEPLVGVVGRLDPMKGHDTFLKAASMLTEDWAALKLVCIGDGPAAYKAHLTNIAESLGLGVRLVWVDSRNDIERMHNAFDVVVSSSTYGEGFPNVIAEAMACGVPCVVTDVGDSAHIVGNLGWVVPPRDPGKLKEALARCLEALEAGRLDKSALRARIVESFSVDKLVTATRQALLRA